MLPQVDNLLTRLSQSKNDMSGYIGGRNSYWDDFCLGMFLKGVCMRYVAYSVSFPGKGVFLLGARIVLGFGWLLLLCY